MASEDWSDDQNNAIVADYFAMLADDVAGKPYNKAEHNRALQSKIGRGKGSIEFKHQNISAVLKGLGEDWITGYKPAFNFQGALVDAVARWLTLNPAWLEPDSRRNIDSMALRESTPLWIGPPPTHSNAPPPLELEQMVAIATKFEPDGRGRLIEVKTTNGWERTPFHITRNELAVADFQRHEWCLVRLWNFAREPKAFEIRPPLSAHVSLTPTAFLAAFV